MHPFFEEPKLWGRGRGGHFRGRRDLDTEVTGDNPVRLLFNGFRGPRAASQCAQLFGRDQRGSKMTLL